MMRQIGVACVLLLGAVDSVPAQRLDATRVGVAPRISPPDSTDPCRPNRVYSAAMGGVAGAAAGWLTFTFGIGALADEHGAEYRRERTKWVIGGAVIGVVLGLVRPRPLPRRQCRPRPARVGPELPLALHCCCPAQLPGRVPACRHRARQNRDADELYPAHVGTALQRCC